MDFAGLSSSLRLPEEGRVYHTIPDAVLYLLTVRDFSLLELANRSKLPLCAIVNLPNRPITLNFDEAEKLALALEAGVGDFTFTAGKPQMDDKVSYKLLDSLTRRLCPEDPEVEPLKVHFG